MQDRNKIEDYFLEHLESFTIYVVELEFALDCGHEFFKQYFNKENFINSNDKMEKFLNKTLLWIQKNIPNIAELVKNITKLNISPTNTSVGLIDVITSLNKVFTVTEHQAAGVNVIDPIIIEEININKRLLSQLVSLHKESITQPAIIIILKDNDFVRAKELISNCPNGINVKFIRNNGETEICKVINNGATDIDNFIDAFARQCFSTCSKTERSVIVNSSCELRGVTEALSPQFFKVRSNLLYDEKLDAISDINSIIQQIQLRRKNHQDNELLLASLEMMAKLNRVYCNDYGGTDIEYALKTANDLDIDLLKAHVYRYSQFIPNTSRKTQKDMLLKAKQIFRDNGVADHSVYCENNYLVHSFYEDRINVRLFHDLQERAIYEVPGMVGMSIILNNTGVAYLYTSDCSEAINLFKKGLDYSKERIVQKIGLKSNMLIAKACSYEHIDGKEILLVLDSVFANFNKKYLPFIGANYATNMLLILLEQHNELVPDVLNKYRIKELISYSLKDNMLGTGSLAQQLIVINSRFPELNFGELPVPKALTSLSGVRARFIMEKGYNPMIFNAWL